MILYRDIDRTVKQIEKFSLKDARTYKEMAEIWVKNIDFLVTSYIFSPPMSFGKMFTLFEGTHEGREFLRMFMTSMEHLIEELFENDRVKAWLLLMGSQVGMPHDMFGSGSFFTPMFPALHRAGAGICAVCHWV